MVLLARLRFALARRPYLYWLFVAACTLVVYTSIASSHSRLADQRRSWGQTRRVWVATADIAPGQPIRSVARDYPMAMVAISAVGTDPADERAVSPIAAGEVIVTGDVGHSPDRLLPDDSVVFAFVNSDTPQLARGSEVAVFGSGRRWCDGVVMALGDRQVDVAVPTGCAGAISLEVANGTIVLAATSP